MNVIFASYGNDSIALIHWAHEQGLDGVTVAYSDTGWSSPSWAVRVARGEALARGYGFATHTIPSVGLPDLVRNRKGWPRQGMQFCTSELKIKPAHAWLDQVDPAREATCLVGVRREESRARAAWPEWTEESDKHGGRSLWAPLVNVKERERDDLIRAAGFEPLPHRSMECWPCVNANRDDLQTLTPKRVDLIEAFEAELGHTSKGKPRTMFRPYRHMGAVGIREVVRWAQSPRGKFGDEDERQGLLFGTSSGCDSGFCGS